MFDQPTPFAEALAALDARRLLPTTASAAELARIAPDLRERALFSARTASAGHLARIRSTVRAILNPSDKPGESVNEARGRELLRESLKAIGYQPSQVGAAPGSLRDLGAARRMNLILDMQVGFARNYGQYAQGMDPAVLDQWPAQEFLRVEEREQPRGDLYWQNRWHGAGGRLFGGRMVALKTDPVWTHLSAFGLPYPPFDYGSGMGVDDVGRDDAIALGLIGETDTLQPQRRPFADNMQATLPDLPADDPLALAILASLGPRARFDDGVLTLEAA